MVEFTSTSPDPHALGPALDFLQRIWHLNHALERLSNRMELRIGVTAQQRLVVRCVGQRAGITPGALAAVLHVDAGTVSAATKRLVDKGLLLRRHDPHDGRRVTLHLSARGRALNRPTDGTVESAVESLLAQRSEHEMRTAAAVIDALTSRLEELVATSVEPARKTRLIKPAR
jgi:DNA-binding MarR family transcriptional regulator